MATKAKAKKPAATKKIAHVKRNAANSKKTVKKLKTTPSKKIAAKSKKLATTTKSKAVSKIKTKHAKKMKKTTSTQKTSAPKTQSRKISASNVKTAAKTITENTKSQPAVGPLAVYKPKKNEEYMSSGQQEYFKQKLLWWKQQIFQDQGSTVAHLQDEALNFPDLIDRASMVEGYNLELKARDRERKFLKKIEESLERLENGEYGYCEDCGSEIGLERLEARPTANQCIDCKTIDEIKEKQAGAV